MRYCFLFLLLFSSLEAVPPAAHLRSLYSSLDPLSVSQHLAFYELYPETTEGKKALKDAWTLLSGKAPEASLALPSLNLSLLIAIVTKAPSEKPSPLTIEQVELIEAIGSRLGNRALKGYHIFERGELAMLPDSEVDLARGLLIHEFEESEDKIFKIRQYEAQLDLMALQILARLPKNATNEEKIEEINRFIFQEMQFRFPPHSLYAKDIDLYTFLPSVLDGRQGVCLGVSILYLSIAERLNLPLAIITPPGHIFVSYQQGGKTINIETTARGIHLPSEVYLGINTRKLQTRTIKEVIGFAFFNQASVYWSRGDYATSISLYEKASLYIKNDPLLNLFLGLNYLFVGKIKEGEAQLATLRGYTFEEAVSQENLADDYFAGNIDIEGLKAIFMPVDEQRTSILEKQKELQTILKRHPRFRAGLLQLAITWLQLGRTAEALETLQRYHLIDQTDATVNYYLSILSLERMNYNAAWNFFHEAQSLTTARSHFPKALKELKVSLRKNAPNHIRPLANK